MKPHLGGASLLRPDPHTWMPDIWRWLLAEYAVKSVVDVGCGAGFSLQWWGEKLGWDRVEGIEGDSRAIVAAYMRDWALGRRMFQHDFAQGPYRFPAGGAWDLGWCAEFVEHVEERFMRRWMSVLKRCRFVAMTFAEPGVPGHHHVNCQPEGYWLLRFQNAGFVCDDEETARMRATSRGELWGRRTLTFFRRAADV